MTKPDFENSSFSPTPDQFLTLTPWQFYQIVKMTALSEEAVDSLQSSRFFCRIENSTNRAKESHAKMRRGRDALTAPANKMGGVALFASLRKTGLVSQ
jgi:hypothetical protein